MQKESSATTERPVFSRETAAATDLPKARGTVENPYAPKEILDDTFFKAVRQKRAMPRPSLKPLLSKRAWDIRGAKYSLMEDTVGIDAENAPKGILPVGESQGLLLFNRADVEDVAGEKYLLLYEQRFGRVVILTGQVKVELEGTLPALPANLSLAQGFPNIGLYFLKTSASSYNELAERLAEASALPGVRNAVLDLVESRFVPK